VALFAVFDVFFSLLALRRHSVRACIFSHQWHRLITGLVLAPLKSKRVIRIDAKKLKSAPEKIVVYFSTTITFFS
jgi:hypothetical protein